MITIDFPSYARAPRISAVSGVILTIRMIEAAPEDPSADEKEALTDMRDAASETQAAVQARHRKVRPSLRPVDREFDGGWAGLVDRLRGWTRLYAEPEAARASALLSSLFPRGIAFVNASYEEQWFHSRMLLARIEDEGLAAEIDELAGPRFLVRIRAAHQALGEGLGLLEGGESEQQAAIEIGRRVSELAEAIAHYTRVLSGSVKLKQPETVERFMKAVAPLDAHRARGGRAGGGQGAELDDAVEEDEELDLDSPLPALPGEAELADA